MAEGKFPKKPEYGKIVIACRKDFRNFKEDNGSRFEQLINEQVMQFTQIGLVPEEFNIQKDNLQNIRKLLTEGKEDAAFSVFFRTFPTCLPHR
ncbi:MAG: hypothetical protein ACFFA3_20795 [Promethearchaeota archaeon]